MMLWYLANCYINIHTICSLYLVIAKKCVQESGYKPSILLWESILMTKLLKLWGFGGVFFFSFLCIFLSSCSVAKWNTYGWFSKLPLGHFANKVNWLADQAWILQFEKPVLYCFNFLSTASCISRFSCTFIWLCFKEGESFKWIWSFSNMLKVTRISLWQDFSFYLPRLLQVFMTF